jgi:environmental stress-induced protein Ves
MRFKKLGATDYRSMEWKNKQGTTVEYAISPEESSVAEANFIYRLSSASMQSSCPFSSFPGYSRILVHLEGSPMTIIHEEKEKVILNQYEKCKFSGDLQTRCEVEGPVRDFNVMTKDGAAEATLDVINLNGSLEIQNEQLCYIYCAEGQVNYQSLTLNPNEFIQCRSKGKLTIDGCSCLLVTHIKILEE